MSDQYSDPLKDLESSGALPAISPQQDDPLKELEQSGVFGARVPPLKGTRAPALVPAPAPPPSADPLKDLEDSGIFGPAKEPERYQGITGGSFERGLVGGMVSTNPAMAGNALEAIGILSDSDTLQNAGRNIQGYAGRTGEMFTPEVPSYRNVTDVKSALKYLGSSAGQGISSMAPGLALGIGAGALTSNPAIGFMVGAAGPSYVQNLGDVYQNIKSDPDIIGHYDAKYIAKVAALAAIPVAALDLVGVGRVGKALTSEARRQIIRTAAKRLLVEGAKGFTVEGVTEGLQEMISQLTGGVMAGNPLARKRVDAVIDNAVGGFLTGGITSGAGGVVSPMTSAYVQRAQLEEQAQKEADKAQQEGLSTAFSAADATVDGPDGAWTDEGIPYSTFKRPEDFINDLQETSFHTGEAPNVDLENFSRFRVDLQNVAPENITAEIRDLPESDQLTADNPKVRLLNKDRATEALNLAHEAVQRYDVGTIDERQHAQELYLKAIDAGFRFKPDSSDSFILLNEATRSPAFVKDKGDFIPPPGFMRGGVYAPSIQSDPNLSIIFPPGSPALNKAPNKFRQSGTYHVDLRRIAKDRLTNIGYSQLKARLPKEALESNAAFTAAIQADPYLRFKELDEGVVSPTGEDHELTQFRTKVKLALNNKAPTAAELRDVGDTLYAYDPSVEGLIFVEGKIPERALSMVPYAPSWKRRTQYDPYDQYDESNIARELDNSSTINGAAYEADKHALGTVQIVVANSVTATPDMLAQAKKVAGLYQELMDTYNIKRRKLVLFVNGMPLLHLTPETGYPFFYVGGGASPVAAISLDFSKHEEGAYFASTAAHEFGHYLMFTEWENLDAGWQEKLLSAYDRALLRFSLSRNTIEFHGMYNAGPWFGFSDLEDVEFTSFLDEPGRTTKVLLDMETGENNGPDYWFSFDEWFAEQTARYFSTQEAPLSLLEKYFKGVGEKVVEVMRLFANKLGGVKPSLFDPAPEVKAFLNNLKERSHQQELGPLLKTGRDLPHSTSEILADKVMAQEQIKGVPSQPTTIEIDTLMRKLKIPTPQRQKFRAISDKISWFTRMGLNLAQMAQRNPHIQGLQLYRELVDRWRIERMKTLTQADLTVRDWTNLGPVMAEKLGRMLFAVDNMEFLSRDEQEREVVRKPSDAEIIQLAQKYKLNDQALELYMQIRDEMDAFIDSLEEAVLYDVEAMVRENAGENDIVDELLQIERARVRREFMSLRQAPYFPHMRFGNFIVAVKDTDGNTIFSAQFDTRKEANAAALKLRRKYAEPDFSVALDQVPETAKTLAGLPPTVLKVLKKRLKLSDEQESQLDAFIAEHLPSRSFRARLLRRRNIAGFSTDAMRAYASYFFHGAGYLARIKWGGRLQDAIQLMEDEKKDLKNASFRGGVADVSKRTQVIDFVRDHFQNIMDPKPDWAQLRSAAFMWHLGFSPKSALVNLTQIPLVTGPYLAARFGDVKALNAIRKATTQFQRTWAKERGDVEVRDDRFFEMVNLGIEQGFLNESLARELADVAIGNNLTRMLPGPEVARKWRQFSYWGAYMFQTAEKFNRSLTFRAAVDLARENPNVQYLFDLEQENQLQVEELRNLGWNPEDIRAFLAGRDAVRKTQFEYQRESRPRFMRGKASTVLTFYMFTQNMLFFATNQPGKGRYLLALIFLAGLMGLPGADDAEEIAKYIARRRFGKDFNVEKEARALVLALLGDDPSIAPDIILHGISRVGFGIPHAADYVGIPVPEFDISSSIGMGNVIPGVGELGRQGSFEDKFSSITTDIAGATFGTGINVFKAMADDRLPWDDFKRWERAMPAALRNISRFYRFAIEGKERTRSGADVALFDASDPTQLMEAIFAGAGFNPTRIARKWDREMMKMEVQKFWAGQRQALMAQFDQAGNLPPGAFHGRHVKADVLDAIKRFNHEVPYRSLIIRPRELRQSKIGRIRERRMFEKGFGGGRRSIPISRDINRLYPEVE